jgi:hypothetical protein
MAERGWLGHGLAVGWFEFRRTVRDVRHSKRQLASIGAGTVMPLLVILAAWLLVRGNVPADFDAGAYTVAVVRGQVTAAWLFFAFMFTQRTASVRPRPDAQSLMLTTVSARTATVGLWLAETLRALGYVGPVALAGTLAVTDLLGTPAILLTLPLATVLFVASSVTVGSLCGYLAALAVARIAIVARYKMWLSGGLSMVVFAVIIAGQTVVPAGPLFDALAAVPLGWLVDLAALGTGVRANATVAVVGAGVALAVIVLGGRAIEMTTAQFWYSTPVSPAADSPQSDPAETAETRAGRWLDGALDSALSPIPSLPVGSRPTRRVASMTVLHTVRNPRRLTIFMIPVFAIGGSLLSSGVGGGFSRALAVGAVAFLPWLPSALFTLNPLGDQQAVLPVTLTTVDPRSFVHGIALPGLVYGLPVAVGLTVVGCVLTSISALETLLLAALAAGLSVTAAAICPAIGSFLPRFSAISVGQADEVLPPRFSAVVFSLGLVCVPSGYLALLVVAPAGAQTLLAGVVGWLPALLVELVAALLSVSLDGVSGFFTGLAEQITGLETGAFRFTAAGVLLSAGVVATLLGYRYAVRTVERYALS